MIGQLLDGRYQVIQILGAGGFGQTYIALDTRRPGNPKCVVKYLKPIASNPGLLETARRLFKSEAETLEQLGNHDQIPRLLAYQDKEFYLVQEFVQGHTLSGELNPGRRWEEREVIQMLQEVLSILEFVHNQGVIHRDIKPDNLIRRDSDRKLVLVDFGAVKQVQTEMAMAQGQMSATVAIGTPGYMPSEQGRGMPRPASDIYSLGMIGIQALTGLMPLQLPEDNQTGEIIWHHLASVTPGLAAVLTKMTSYHFKDRYQSAGEVLQALQELTNAYPPTQPPAYTPPPTPSTSQQHTVAVVPNNPSQPQVRTPTAPVAPVSRPPRVFPLLLGVGVAAACVGVGAVAFKAAQQRTSSSKTCFAVVTPDSNIRSEPSSSTRQNIIRTVQSQTNIPVTGRRTQGGWIEVKLDDGRLAWAHTEVMENNQQITSCLKANKRPFQVVDDALLITKRPSPSPTPKPTNSATPSPDKADKPTVKDEGRAIFAKAVEKFQAGDLPGAIALAKSIPPTSSAYPQVKEALQEWPNNWRIAQSKFINAQKAFDEGRWQDVIAFGKDPSFPQIRFWRDKLQQLVVTAEKNQKAPDASPSPSPSPSESPSPSPSPSPSESPSPSPSPSPSESPSPSPSPSPSASPSPSPSESPSPSPSVSPTT
jgi:serine/threonine-protein kinase